MPSTAARLAVQRSAALGDRARRRAEANWWIARCLPWATAACAAVSLVTLLVGRARLLGIVLLAFSGVAAACVRMAARLARPVPDEAVAVLDARAELQGALRSAHWFAIQEDAGGSTDSPWVAYHLETAATRLDGVDWAAVYVPPPASRRWIAAAALATVSVALSGWESPRLAWRSADALSSDGDTVIVVPPHLAGEVVEGMNAIKAGTPPSKRALQAVGQAIEIGRKDPRARRALEDLFAQAADGEGRFLEMGMENHDWDVNEMPFWDDGTPRLQWAYEAAVARAAVQEPDDASGQQPSASDDAADGRTGEMQRGVRGTMTADSAVLAATQGRPGSFSSLLFGRQAATDAAATAAPRPAAAPNAGLAAALRREVVHARTDGGEGARSAVPRRPLDSAPTPDGDRVAATGIEYDPASAGRPPAVPIARRELLHDFFARAADATPDPRQP